MKRKTRATKVRQGKKRVLSPQVIGAVIATAVLLFSAFVLFTPPLEEKISIQVLDEFGEPIANEKVVLGYSNIVLTNENEDSVQIQKISEITLDENGKGNFLRLDVERAEEENAEKGTALFQIAYEDGTVTLKIPQPSKKVNKMVFNLLPTPKP
ncbi:MAG: hypothetical protein ACE5DI_02125 [Candidatus Micrarchaeia archaeon]